MIAWWNEQRRTFFGNANSVKEYRIQLRSTKAMWGWTFYLGVLILAAITNYMAIENVTGRGSASAIQNGLTDYYNLVMGFIQGAILLVAPLISAASLVSEYELRSIELVQSSPASTKYFLVGKYIAAIRQIILLLALAIPVAAVGVTLGGATWNQVLEHFFLIFLSAAVACAVAMPIAISTKSVLRTMAGVLASMFFGSLVLSAVAASLSSVGTSSGVPFMIGLVPFFNSFAIGQSVLIGPWTLPLWVVTAGLSYMIIRTLVVGAASAMTRLGSKETRAMRIQGLVLGAFYGFVMYTVGASMAPMGASGGLMSSFGVVGTAMTVLLYPMIQLVSHGRLEERKFFADRLFVWKDVLAGRPSGGWLYGFILSAFVVVGFAIGIGSALKPLHTFAILLWCLCFSGFAMALTWWISTGFDTVVAARRVAFGAVIGVGLFSHYMFGILAASAAGLQDQSMMEMLLALNPFLPYAAYAWQLACKSAVLLALGGLALWFGEKKRGKNIQVLLANGYKVDRDELIAKTS
jgi:ABC-type transport system involved in multi-copper enzyme maturation permease subunit